MSKLRKWFKNIARILIADKLPYLFTILIGLIAYQVDHFINNLSETPLVNYGFQKIDSKDSAGFKVDSIQVLIANLSKKRCFKNLDFDIKYRYSGTLKTPDVYAAELIAIAPSMILPDSNARNSGYKLNNYKIPQLQPNGQYYAILKLRYKGEFEEMPSVYLNSKDNILLTNANSDTFIIKNQVWINLILIILSLVGIILYATYYTPDPSNPQLPQSN